VDDAVLSRPIHVGGANRPFGSLTLHEVEARAEELHAAAGWGPTMRVKPVARAWSELARRMDEAGAATVADLDPQAVAELAQSLWVTPDL
jgi:hypothetical protein